MAAEQRHCWEALKSTNRYSVGAPSVKAGVSVLGYFGLLLFTNKAKGKEKVQQSQHNLIKMTSENKYIHHHRHRFVYKPFVWLRTQCKWLWERSTPEILVLCVSQWLLDPKTYAEQWSGDWKSTVLASTSFAISVTGICSQVASISVILSVKRD